jgi:cysteine desulfuration protein SufE
VPTELDAIVAELSEADKQERIELLIDFARSLPPLPERYVRLKDEEHRVHECQSPVFLFVELEDDRVTLHADVPVEAPTVRGFVSILVQGLQGATVTDVSALRGDLIHRLGLTEILGMQRLSGLNGVLHHIKSRVARAAAG